MHTLDRAPHLTIVIPAYNEENRIIETLLRIDEYLDAQAYSSEVVVVDDGSTDSTFDLVEKFADSHKRFKVLHHEPNRGKGYAVRSGVLTAAGEYVLISDADLATPIEELEHLWNHISDGADIAIASRPLRESKLVERQPFYREFAGRAFNWVVRLLAVRGIHDTQCGFKLFNRDCAQAIFARCTLDGFSFDIEVLHLAQRLGYRIAEVPVHWYHRPGSKVRLLRDGLRMMADLVRIRLRHRGVCTNIPDENRRI